MARDPQLTNAQQRTQVRSQPGRVRAFAMAVLIHGVLLIALVYSVHWQTAEPQNISAELWSALPAASAQVVAAESAPVPPAPIVVEPVATPEVTKPDIVLDIEPKKEIKPVEPKPAPKVETKPEPKPEPKPKAVPKINIDLGVPTAQETPREKQTKDSLRDQILGGAAGGRSGAPDTGYAAQVRSCIKQYMVFNAPDDAPNYQVEYLVSLLPTGEQGAAPKLLKPSGNSQFDSAVERAVRRCDPFPRPQSGVFDRTVNVTHYLKG